MSILRRLITLFLLGKLAVLISNLFQFPVLHEVPDEHEPQPDVSLLIPVRNEAGTLLDHLPAMLRQKVGEVIVLDDESTDDSWAQAESLVAEHFTVVSGAPTPPSWVGKNWACHQLAAVATGSVLIFCDADVQLADGAIDRVLDAMRTQRADVLSVFPQQLTRSLGEHLVMPLIDDAVLCLLPFGLLSLDVPSAATANGSLLAFTRSAYDQLGGFAAVRTELVEDVALARRTRQAGLKLGLVLGGDQVSTRMYDGYRPIITGLGRGLSMISGGRRWVLVLGLVWHVMAYTLPWAMAARRPAWLMVVALGVTERLLVEAKTGRRQFWQALLTPLSPIAVTPVVAQSLRAHQTWKGRVYS
jgi:cellulose synthase/poly-beta-1,6-N-acetylglucosamine synthase-like glycosyltransferase